MHRRDCRGLEVLEVLVKGSRTCAVTLPRSDTPAIARHHQLATELSKCTQPSHALTPSVLRIF